MGFQIHLIGAECHAELISDAMQKMTLLSTCDSHLAYELIEALGVELSPYGTYTYGSCLHAPRCHDLAAIHLRCLLEYSVHPAWKGELACKTCKQCIQHQLPKGLPACSCHCHVVVLCS